MAWSSPATAVANSLFSAAWLNTNLRDNLLETMPAKATDAGQIFTVTTTNEIGRRTPAVDYVATSEVRTPSTYADLATTGPSVTVTMNSFLVIRLSAQISSAASGGEGFMSFAITGATSLSADDSRAVGSEGTASRKLTYYVALTTSSVNAGSNTITAKYRGDGTNTATFVDRELSTVAL